MRDYPPPSASSPINIGDAIAYAASAAPDNLTVKALAADRSALSHICDTLAKIGIHHVLPMTHKARHAVSSVALYAGDGIVAKITDESQLEKRFDSRLERDGAMIVPGVLPPISRFKNGAVITEIYPWIDRHGANKDDVERMKKTLARYNLRFKPGDDKTANIGILPGQGRMPAVLDPDAVELLDKNFGILSADTRRWEKEVHSRFAPLYSRQQSETSLVGEHPDFTERFSPLLNTQRRQHAALAGSGSGAQWQL